MISAEWFRTWFDTDYYHLLYSNRDEKEARQFIDALLSFLKPNIGSTFIDIACGKGRHSMQLAENRFNTTGVDLSENSILQAQKAESDLLKFFVHDIRKPFRGDKFDFALNLFTSFGYFETMAEHYKALENIYNTLNPKGIFVFDYLNSASVNCDTGSSNEVEFDGIKFITSKAIVENHIIKTIKVVDGDSEMTFEEKVMAFGESDLLEKKKKIGFTILSTHGNYQLGGFDSNQPRLIIIAQKKK